MHVIFANLWCLNPCLERAVDALVRHDPDLIAVAELAPRKFAAVARRLSSHPQVLVVPTDRRCSLALFSRLPLTAAAVVRVGACRERPYGKALLGGTHPCTILLAHTTAPFTPAMAARRNAQIDCLASEAAADDGPLILLGDLNADHGSAPLQRLATHGGLLSPRTGPRQHPNWPAPLPWRTFDHILHSAHLVVEQFGSLPAHGSDHRPLFAVFRTYCSPTASNSASTFAHGTSGSNV